MGVVLLDWTAFRQRLAYVQRSRMTRVLQVAKLLALLCACGFFVVSSVFYIRVGAVLEQLQATITQLNVSGTAANLNRTLDAVNRPCGTKQPCGTLADVAKTLGTFRGAAGQIEVAANHENRRLKLLDAQEAAIYSNANASLEQLREDLRTANTTIAGVQPVLTGLTRETASLQLTTESARELIANPQIPVILNNTAAATGSVSQAAGHLDATTADVQHAVHAALHPTVVHKVLNVMTNAAHIVFAVVF